MTANVDPFIQPIPQKFMEDAELRAWCEYLHNHLFQHWTRTGGSEDAISNADVQEKYSWELRPEREAQSRSIQFNLSEAFNAFNAVSTSSNYTLCDYDFVNASNGITLALPEYPQENSIVIIRNSDGEQLTIDGNGKNINGDTDAIFRSKGSSVVIQYFIDSDEWFSR